MLFFILSPSTEIIYVSIGVALNICQRLYCYRKMNNNRRNDEARQVAKWVGVGVGIGAAIGAGIFVLSSLFGNSANEENPPQEDNIEQRRRRIASNSGHSSNSLNYFKTYDDDDDDDHSGVISACVQESYSGNTALQVLEEVCGKIKLERSEVKENNQFLQEFVSLYY